MHGDLAVREGARSGPCAVRSVACLGFVIALAAVAWAGAMWVGQLLLEIAHLG